MLPSALSLFLLRELPFSHFTFPRWQSISAITLTGLLVGLDPAFRAGSPEAPGIPLWFAVLFGALLVWVGFLLVIGILKWWLKRGQRWDGQGDLFNLVAASWLVADVLGAGLTALGMPPLVTLPLWFYSVWVGGNALSGAMPKVSLGYAITGILITVVLAIVVSGLVGAVLGGVLAALGLMPPPSAV
jgi:hypothetical protein